jgi:hypothetical protein
MSNIAPKPTTYRGIRFDSRLEAKTAVLLDNCKNVMSWRFEPITFRLSPQNWTYTPDFEVNLFLHGRQSRIYLEVKPLEVSRDYAKVLQAMTTTVRYPLFIFMPDFWKNSYLSYAVRTRCLKVFDIDHLLVNFHAAFDLAHHFRFDLRPHG